MNANILVVDDIPENLLLLAEILRQQGYKVRTAPNGHLAQETVQMMKPDLILLDILMPDMDGYQVCKRLQGDSQTRDIPVIFISGLSGTFDKVKAFSAGAVDYISKPFQTEEVLARVHTHLALQDTRKTLQVENQKRRETEAQLRESNRQLEEVNASKDKLFSIIAHDLRNPFSGLLSLMEVLLEDFNHYEREEIKSKLTMMHRSSQNAYALLTNLLHWSRLERGLLTPEPLELNLRQAIGPYRDLFSTNASQKQLCINADIPEELRVYADFNMLNTILGNLLSNAIKFTPAGGTIEISATQGDESIDIRITDNGIGMDREQLEDVFRIDAKSSRRGTAGEVGTGLGLILCKELVEKQGGDIQVESDVGTGTTFTVTLPDRAM